MSERISSENLIVTSYTQEISDELVDSILKNGVLNAVDVSRKTRIVINGKARVLVAQRFGFTVPVRWVDD